MAISCRFAIEWPVTEETLSPDFGEAVKLIGVLIGGEGLIVAVSPWGDPSIPWRMRLRTASPLGRAGVPSNQ